LRKGVTVCCVVVAEVLVGVPSFTTGCGWLVISAPPLAFETETVRASRGRNVTVGTTSKSDRVVGVWIVGRVDSFTLWGSAECARETRGRNAPCDRRRPSLPKSCLFVC